MSRICIDALIDAPSPRLSVSSLLNPELVAVDPRKRLLAAAAELDAKRVCLTPEPVAASEPFGGPHSPTRSSVSTLSSLTSGDATGSPVSVTPSSPCPDSPCPKADVDRFTNSRIVGQKHRDKEDEALADLKCQVDDLLEDNRILQLTVQRAMNGLNTYELAELRSLLKKELRSHYPACHRVSDRAAAMLGAYYWSGAVALILLETIATRRNLVSFPRDSTKRRRKNTLECAPMSMFDAMLQTASANIEAEARFVQRLLDGVPAHRWVRVVCEWLVNAHKAWSDMEDSTGPPRIFVGATVAEADKVGQSEVKRRRRSRKESGFVGDHKRCSRCKKDKTAGSGHPRSHCDDGMEVCSPDPYIDPMNSRSLGKEELVV